MTMLSPSDRNKLIGILGMLGSDHEGERASAGLLASRMLRDRRLQWADLIATDLPRHEPPPSGFDLWRVDLALAQRHARFCSTWEQRFLSSIACRATLSAKQRDTLREIAESLRLRGLT